MAGISSGAKRTAVAVALFLGLAAMAIAPIRGRQVRIEQTRALNSAKQIWLSCKQYAIDHNGQFPESLGELTPTYIVDPNLEAIVKGGPADGWIYTPGLKETDPGNPVVIKHDHIEVRLNGSARVLHTP